MQQTRLAELCKSALAERQLQGAYAKRLTEELREIEVQQQADYFLDLYDRGVKYKENENNLLVPCLLGIVQEVAISESPRYDYGDFPDCDVDLIPGPVRDYLKNVYTREIFGTEYVCDIVTYTTFGLRNSLIDMARVFGLDRAEILSLTTRLGIKDDEGETLTWDKALELYPELKAYTEAHPEMAEAACRLIGRNRNMGKHASGLIISSVPIQDFVPVVVPKGSTVPAAAWVEGLHGTDLGAVGLVKFDFLGLDATLKIAKACYLVQQAYGLEKVCAEPGGAAWSDLRYLNDDQALQMANAGDLRMIFQFDGSDGIRRLCKQGGVSCFEDLVAYVSLYRPGCMKTNMHTAYIERKNQREQFDIHPLLEPFLAETYGVMVFQEQCMRNLNTVGLIPLRDCEAARKAISKKKPELFEKLKCQYVDNGQQTLGLSKEEMEWQWDQIAAWAGYGFNKSHAVAYSYNSSRMLYLKAHYPVQFYSAGLSETHAAGPKDYLKLKANKQEAIRHKVPVHRLDLNRSGRDFRIEGNGLYYAFSKIKGIGDEAVKELVRLQPYADLKDFLERFGCDAKVVQALIGLRVFGEDVFQQYEYYERFKQSQRKQKAQQKTYERRLEKLHEELKQLMPTVPSLDQLLANCYDGPLPATWSKRWLRARKTYESKQPSELTIDGPVKLDAKYLRLLGSSEACEEAYYGFRWRHLVEQCDGYQGYTFDNFEENVDASGLGRLEVEVKSAQFARKPRCSYYKVRVEDGNGEVRSVRVWERDYNRFVQHFQPGKMVRLTVSNSQYGFAMEPVPWSGPLPPESTDLRVYPLKKL